MAADFYDVAIIGAGPAGTACALALQNSGLQVVLIDKATFPRDKACGDAVPVMAFKAMDHINPEWGQAMRNFLDKTEISAAEAYMPNGKSLKRTWSGYTCNSKRIDFDNFLLQLVRTNTNTTIIENKRVESVEVSNDYVVFTLQDETTLKASVIIGCDGANSVITRQLGKFDFRGDHIATAVRCYFHGIEGLQKGVNEVHFFKEFMPGYFWIFPLENGWANVGFGVFSDKTGHNKDKLNLREAIQTITTSFPSIAPRFRDAKSTDSYKGFALPLGTRKRKISGKRFMLCGDAAALIDPIGGNGIDNAMWSGSLAAEQAIQCFRNGDFSATHMKKFDKAVYKKIGSQLFYSTCLMRLFQRFPSLFNKIASILQYRTITNLLIRLFKM
jgi:geranylgeranyl reductase family protein